MTAPNDTSFTIRCLQPDLPTCEEILPYLEQIDKNQWYSNFGPLVGEFEKQLTTYLTDFSERQVFLTTTATGTAALELVLAALELPKQARILVPSFTFPATVTAIVRAGYVPIFTDVDPYSWALTPELAETILEHVDVDAIVTVSAFGQRHKVDAWDTLSTKKNIPIVIDAAAGFGNQSIGKKTIVTHSLHATKPFGIGEGGLVCAHDQAFIEKTRSLSNFGFVSGSIANIGSNAKLSEYHAAVGLVQLKRFAKIQNMRQRLWKTYLDLLFHYTPLGDFITLPLPITRKPLATLCITTPFDAEIATHALRNFGIETRRWYYPPVHEHPACNKFQTINASGSSTLDVTENLKNCLIGLPFHTRLTLKHIQMICDVLFSSFRRISKEQRATTY